MTIYKITKLTDNNIYIGRTSRPENRIRERLTEHIYRKTKCMVSWIDRDCIIEVIETTEDPTRERFWIEYYKDNIEFNCLNININMSIKEHQDKFNKSEKCKQYKKKYAEENKDLIKSINKRHYEKRKQKQI